MLLLLLLLMSLSLLLLFLFVFSRGCWFCCYCRGRWYFYIQKYFVFVGDNFLLLFLFLLLHYLLIVLFLFVVFIRKLNAIPQHKYKEEFLLSAGEGRRMRKKKIKINKPLLHGFWFSEKYCCLFPVQLRLNKVFPASCILLFTLEMFVHLVSILTIIVVVIIIIINNYLFQFLFVV